MAEQVYEVLLEKKARGRGFSLTRPWTVRTFKLTKQSLEYYDGEKLKGTVEINGASCGLLPPEEADHKLFPFHCDNGKEKLILNASCEEIRQRCLQIFTLAATDPDWTLAAIDPNPALLAAVSLLTMNGSDEKEKLEAQQKVVEAERLNAVTDATARILEEELANKKLQQAREAEGQQHEAQEQEVMNLLKGLGAKSRFQTALKHGKMSVARDAAAAMLQGQWRCKLAQRKIILKRAEKERLLRDGYARKIQSRYRCRLAKRRVEKAKAEKLRIKKEISSITIQCNWRIYKARKAFTSKQDERLAAEYNRKLARQRGIIKMQNTIRAFSAKRRVSRLLVHVPTVVTATITKVEGLNVSDPTHCDPAAVVSGCVLNVPPTEPHRVNPYYQISDETIKQHGKITSHYHVKNVSSKTVAMATALSSMDFLVVTLVDRNSPHKDDCLGQAFIRISDVRRQLYKTKSSSVDITVPVHSHLILPIIDANKESLVTVRKAATGTVTVSVSIADPAYSTCGWLWKVSESMLSNAWKKRWFVLMNGELQYFNSELNLELKKHVIVGQTITSFKELPQKGRQATRIAFTSDAKDSFWDIDFDENQSNAIKRLWLRKLYRAASNIEKPVVN